jgi:hypothetical protein
MKFLTALSTMLLGLLAVAAVASASQQDKEWICHGTGSDSNPYVLINVPTNSAHFTKHLVDGSDKLPVKVDGGLSCGGEDSPPTPPFTGNITFTLVQASCAEGEQGVPGFEVIMEQFSHGDYLLTIDGRDTGEQVIFDFPPTCISTGTGPAGPAGPAGPTGPAGSSGVPGANATTPATTTSKACVSRRTFMLYLPVKTLRHARSVTVTVAGVTRTMHPNKAGKVRISLVGLKKGVYGVVVKTPKGVTGIDPKTGLTRAGFFARIYTVCGAGNVTAVNVPTPKSS